MNPMLPVTRMNNQRIHLNPDFLEAIEESGDTVLVLTNGHRLVVKESADEVVSRMLEYRKSLLASIQFVPESPDQILHAVSSHLAASGVNADEVAE